MASLRSMTGYGQASTELPGFRVSVELRTVNHRFADLRLRLPAGLAGREAEIRRRVLARGRRGRVDMSLRIEALDGPKGQPLLNRPLVEEVMRSAQVLRDEFAVEGRPDLASLLCVPGLFSGSSEEFTWGEAEQQKLDELLGEALDALEAERLREGGHLERDLVSRLETITGIVDAIRARAGEIPTLVRDRLLERLAALTADLRLDPARLAQEAAVLAERADVTEEIVRLDGHLEQVGRLVRGSSDKPVGKRLEFLLQEIGREANTIASKSPDLELSRHVVELKAEIEKVREQIQNLE